MIKYRKTIFGLSLLPRVHGSAIYRAVVPATMACLAYTIIRKVWKPELRSELLHPYAAGVLIGGITFLLVFRVTQSYERYCKPSRREAKCDAIVIRDHCLVLIQLPFFFTGPLIHNFLLLFDAYSQGKQPERFTGCKANGWMQLFIFVVIICSRAITIILDRRNFRKILD